MPPIKNTMKAKISNRKVLSESLSRRVLDHNEIEFGNKSQNIDFLKFLKFLKQMKPATIIIAVFIKINQLTFDINML